MKGWDLKGVASLRNMQRKFEGVCPAHSQTDYPRGLIRKNIKKYLAHWVAAAFECKLTLRAEHIKKVFENASDIKKRHHYGIGTPFRELHSPIIYDLQAHAYDPRTKQGSVQQAINQKICECDLAMVKHPKEMPDLFCIASS